MHRYPQDKIASYSEFPSKHYSLFKIEDIRVNVTQFRSLSQGYMYLCHMVRAKMTLAHILDASLPSFCLSVVDYRRRILYAPAANFYATRKEDDEKAMPCTPPTSIQRPLIRQFSSVNAHVYLEARCTLAVVYSDAWLRQRSLTRRVRVTARVQVAWQTLR